MLLLHPEPRPMAGLFKCPWAWAPILSGACAGNKNRVFPIKIGRSKTDGRLVRRLASDFRPTPF